MARADGLAGDLGLTRLNLARVHVSKQSLIEKVLGNNGNVTTSELDDYVQDDVFRYGAKLDDMHKKLRQALDEQVSVSVPPNVENLPRSADTGLLSRSSPMKMTTRLGKMSCCCGSGRGFALSDQRLIS